MHELGFINYELCDSGKLLNISEHVHLAQANMAAAPALTASQVAERIPRAAVGETLLQAPPWVRMRAPRKGCRNTP